MENNNRESAMIWWNGLASLEKTQLCDLNTEYLNGIRRWEHLTGRERIFISYLQIKIMEPKLFYRVANTITNQGLWYDNKGEFTGLIHKEFRFCKNNALPMEYDENVLGYLSTTTTLEELFHWFTEEDIKRLEAYDYYITLFVSTDYREYNNHWLINQNTSIVIGQYPIDGIHKLLPITSQIN